MLRSFKLTLTWCTATVLVSSFVSAAPKDKAASKIMDKAINEHYLATDFKKAEDVLLGTVKTCKDQCSASVIARAWMLTGIVRGSGKNDQKGAKKAFEEALEADPEVVLDANLATAPTKKSFEATAKKLGVSPAKPADSAPEEADDAELAEEPAEPTEMAEASQNDSCSDSSDCGSGFACVSGTCEPTAEASDGSATSSELRKNWVGLHFGVDFSRVGGRDVCAGSSANNDSGSYACFIGDRYFGLPLQAGAAGSVGSTFARGTMRLLASFDRVVTSNVTIGGRLGYAFGGGPTPVNGNAFLPVHVEARGAYWFGGAPFQAKLRPYVQIGAGLAQVDTKIANVGVRQADTAGTIVYVDAWHKVGLGFLEAGGGLALAFTDRLAGQLNLNAMLMLGDSGLVLEPSLGVVYGL